MASWIRIHKNMRIHGKISTTKMQDKFFILNPNLNHKKNEIIKVTLFLNGWLIKFYYNENKQQKSYKKNLNSALLKIHRYRNIPNNYIINTTINLVIIIIMYWSSRSIPNNYTINTTINWVIIIIMYWSSRSIPNKYTIKKTINQKSYQGHKLIEITRRRLGWLIYCLQKYTSTFFV